jgi:hypothetical protein
MKPPRIEVEVVGHPPWRHWGFTCTKHPKQTGMGFQDMLNHLHAEHAMPLAPARKHLDALRIEAGRRN